MKILILGGTIFLGRHIVEQAQRRGHQITLFNRGRHHPDLFPDVEKLHGDRDGDLQALIGRHWDAVIDPSGYLPRLVRDSARLLVNAVSHYTFISSISVYADPPFPHMDESAPLGRIDDETVEEINGETYGPLKVLCEQAVFSMFPDRSLVVRPGLIVGPFDQSDRFTYWPARTARGGEVLAPGKPDYPVQFIDVRDLALWIVSMVEKRETGIYNATGSESRLSMGQLLENIKQATDSDANFTWVADEFLLAHQVEPYTDMPLWLPLDYVAMSQVDCRKAFQKGLEFRSLSSTILDTLEWDRTRSPETNRKCGLDDERERALLAEWHRSNQNDAA
jgi:2'-hydroxyisoflavone reductase